VKSVGADIIPFGGKVGAQVEVCLPSPIFENTSISLLGRVANISAAASGYAFAIGLKLENPGVSKNLRLSGGVRFNLIPTGGGLNPAGLEGFVRLGVKMLDVEF
jgi:hypothetical protein